MTKLHQDRVRIINEFLEYEKAKKAGNLKNLLEKMMAETFPLPSDSKNVEFFELKIAMLYNYIHRRQVSHSR